MTANYVTNTNRVGNYRINADLHGELKNCFFLCVLITKFQQDQHHRKIDENLGEGDVATNETMF